jgi:hypothetical protein
MLRAVDGREQMSSVPLAADAGRPRVEVLTILRHHWPLRLMHWLNLGFMLAMVGSGLQILNAHPPAAMAATGKIAMTTGTAVSEPDITSALHVSS